MLYALRHKESGRFVAYSGSSKIPYDERYLVDIEYAQTLASLAGAKSSLKNLLSMREAMYAAYVPGHPDYNRIRPMYSQQHMEEQAKLFIRADEMEIVQVSLQVLGSVE